MDNGIDQGLEQSFLAVLGQVLARRLFPGRDSHVPYREGQSLSDLFVKRTTNGLSVKLAGCPVNTLVTGGGYAGVGEPILG